jgi:predicted dehydrogenase
MKKRSWKIAGINFDHFHMGDLLRYAHEHPNAEIVGISDEQPARMEEAVRKGLVRRDQAFTDYRECLEKTKPDVVLLCPAASKHGEWVKKVAPYGAHLMVEKPFAASLKEADAMVKCMGKDQRLMINWPLQWVASHRKAYELVSSGKIGEVLNVWHIGGNRGRGQVTPEGVKTNNNVFTSPAAGRVTAISSAENGASVVEIKAADGTTSSCSTCSTSPAIFCHRYSS